MLYAKNTFRSIVANAVAVAAAAQAAQDTHGSKPAKNGLMATNKKPEGMTAKPDATAKKAEQPSKVSPTPTGGSASPVKPAPSDPVAKGKKTGKNQTANPADQAADKPATAPAAQPQAGKGKSKDNKQAPTAVAPAPKDNKQTSKQQNTKQAQAQAPAPAPAPVAAPKDTKQDTKQNKQNKQAEAPAPKPAAAAPAPKPAAAAPAPKDAKQDAKKDTKQAETPAPKPAAAAPAPKDAKQDAKPSKQNKQNEAPAPKPAAAAPAPKDSKQDTKQNKQTNKHVDTPAPTPAAPTPASAGKGNKGGKKQAEVPQAPAAKTGNAAAMPPAAPVTDSKQASAPAKGAEVTSSVQQKASSPSKDAMKSPAPTPAKDSAKGAPAQKGSGKNQAPSKDSAKAQAPAPAKDNEKAQAPPKGKDAMKGQAPTKGNMKTDASTPSKDNAKNETPVPTKDNKDSKKGGQANKGTGKAAPAAQSAIPTMTMVAGSIQPKQGHITTSRKDRGHAIFEGYAMLGEENAIHSAPEFAPKCGNAMLSIPQSAAKRNIRTSLCVSAVTPQARALKDEDEPSSPISLLRFLSTSALCGVHAPSSPHSPKPHAPHTHRFLTTTDTMAQANGSDASGNAATTNTNGSNTTSKSASGAPAPVDPADTLTFHHQTTLPKLPIPPLEETCARYLEYIHALQSPEEYETSKQRVADFLAHDGPALQQKLIEYDQDKKSYIEDFWYEAYLNHRSSVVLNVNPFFVLEDDPTPSRNNQISRATSLVLGSLKFINALRKGTLEPDMWRNSMALCMNQYKRLFGCARMPTASKDEAFVDDKSKHIVVMCRNQFYWFDVIWEDGVTAITERELVNNLKAIKENAMQATDIEAASQAIGVLTTEHRANWAKLRQKLIVKNAESLAVVDRALFLVCLDNTTPPDAAAFASTALHGTYDIVNGVQIGTCMNRWYDKLQIIVCENGVAGVNFEHSFVDGHTVLRFVSDVYTDTIIRFAQTIRGGSYSFLEASYRAPQLSQNADKPRVTPRKLEWSLDLEIEEGIKFAEAKLSDLILQNEVDVLEFTSFGKLFITQHNMSPDAFVQMAFIAAYYFQYGSAPNVYEPVLTKRFLHGRTEAARSMTKEALEFLDVFFTEKSPIDKIESLKKAINAQVKVVRDCAAGKGVERHLFALECLWQTEQRTGSLTGQTLSASKPAIFSDIGWEKLNHTILSTSNCGNPSLRLFGFGPVSPDGFGIGYIIKDEGIQFCASSKHRQTSRYLKNLEAYLLRVQDLLLQEEGIRFPNTKQASKSISSSFKGYGFFDSGATAPAGNSSDISIARVGRPL